MRDTHTYKERERERERESLSSTLRRARENLLIGGVRAGGSDVKVYKEESNSNDETNIASCMTYVAP